jgi:hypothetical protein
MKISIFTTYTDPDLRNDPWKEAISCYEDFADEVVITGHNWPSEFSWELIGETFQEGFEKTTGDWALRMDIDYFFHEKHLSKLRRTLNKYTSFPGVVFPQYQFFTADRFQMKTRLCLALNKKYFSNIKLNAGGDLCLASLDNNILPVNKLPNVRIPVFQYDSMFRTKEIIANDRARFARAWYNYFGEFGNRGGDSPQKAYDAWFLDISKKYMKHVNKINYEDHPKYIQEKLEQLDSSQFGYDAFGLKGKIDRKILDTIKGKKEIYIDDLIYNLNLKKHIFK